MDYFQKITTKYVLKNVGSMLEVGSGAGKGYNVNIPWPHDGIGDAEYMAGAYMYVCLFIHACIFIYTCMYVYLYMYIIYLCL